ncbi:hypothetical protein B0H15DRAFT_1019692 [Mycena belliarum]|uniref:Uncharacterized protein n=1 Tax=Mycena belliarum TaxID=1033014 RepID=A0AAD6UB95_9AGAR|nr:hypothetical protein B0H15DRAFT_1019692 [Mycena belliae]
MPSRKSPRLEDLPHQTRVYTRAGTAPEPCCGSGARTGQRSHPHGPRTCSTPCYSAEVKTAAEKKLGHQQCRTLSDHLALGFKLVHWNDGDARPVVDVHGRIVALLAPRPTNVAASEAFAALAVESNQPNSPPTMHHCRCAFLAVQTGMVANSQFNHLPSY